MRGVRPIISFGALAGFLTFAASIGGSLPRATGLVAAGVGLLLAFTYALLSSPAMPASAVRAVADPSSAMAPASAFVMQAAGPYVSRDVDPALRYAIASGRPDSLILVSGDPRSGKTRSAWMAVQNIRPGALLYVADEPRYDNAPDAARPIEAARAALDDSPYDVLWLDDLSLHLGRGLSALVLRELAEREVLVVATIREPMLEVLRLTDPELWTELRVRARTFRMSAELSDSESESLGQEYQELGTAERRFLPADFAHNDLLSDRYTLALGSSPLGVAYIDAAWLWQGFGMPRYCPVPFLTEIANSLVDGRRWPEAPDEDVHREAIEWAAESVGGFHGLLIRDPLGGDAYRVADAVSGLVEASYKADALAQVLSIVIAAASLDDGLAVANAMSLRMARNTAVGSTSSMDPTVGDTLLLEWVNRLLPALE